MHKLISTLGALAATAALTAAGLPQAAAAAPAVPGFTVTSYAVVADQSRITFGSDGSLFIGNTNNAGSGASLHRVAPGGGAVGGYGPAVFDPDAVLFDASGVVSGVPGSVLVGGDAITAIRPDQTSVVLFSGAAGFSNVGDLAFDQSGRLLFTDSGNGDPNRRAVFAVEGGILTRLFSEAGGETPDSIAVSATNQIYTSRSDGGISVHAADGSLVNGSFSAALNPYPAIDFARGGTFGDQLYALDAVTGVLWRFDAAGQAAMVGSGFGPNSNEIAFGPDGALYVGDFNNHLVLRVAAVPEPASWGLMLAGAAAVALRLRRRR